MNIVEQTLGAERYAEVNRIIAEQAANSTPAEQLINEYSLFSIIFSVLIIAGAIFLMAVVPIVLLRILRELRTANGHAEHHTQLLSMLLDKTR